MFSVGYPIQSPLDALLTLRREHEPDARQRREASCVRLPEDGARIVDGNAMPDVNLQHLMAVALIDGTVSFEMSHSRERMKDPQVLAREGRVQLVGDRALVDPASAAQRRRGGDAAPTAAWSATSRGIRRARRRTRSTRRGVAAKARDLMAPVIGAGRADAVISRVNKIEEVRDARDLVRLMRRP